MLKMSHGPVNLCDVTRKEAVEIDIQRHVEFIGVCHPQRRARGASTVAIDEINVGMCGLGDIHCSSGGERQRTRKSLAERARAASCNAALRVMTPRWGDDVNHSGLKVV